MPQAAKQLRTAPRFKQRTNRLYNRRAWRRLSQAVRLERVLCQECKRQGKRTLATCVDHVVPHQGNQQLFWDYGNLQALCQTCHSCKTGKEGGAALTPVS